MTRYCLSSVICALPLCTTIFLKIWTVQPLASKVVVYTNVDKEMLFLVVSYKEVVGIKQKIREVDPKAFVVVTDAYDAFGEGWKELPMAGEVQPE